MLTVLRVISQHLEERGLQRFTSASVRKDDFKIIYVSVTMLVSVLELN
jgi:hypothetical protein